MKYGYNSWGKKPDSNVPNNDDPLVKLKEIIMNHINMSVNSLRDGSLNWKVLVAKRLQSENTCLQSNCISL